MSLLQALGIDITVLIQFAIASYAFLSLAIVVFRPFQAAYLSRLKNTIGSQSETAEIFEKIKIIQENYEIRTRELNSQLAQIFANQKKQTSEKQAQKIQFIQNQLKELQAQNEKQMLQFRQSFQGEKVGIVNELSEAILKTLISKAKP